MVKTPDIVVKVKIKPEVISTEDLIEELKRRGYTVAKQPPPSEPKQHQPECNWVGAIKAENCYCNTNPRDCSPIISGEFCPHTNCMTHRLGAGNNRITWQPPKDAADAFVNQDDSDTRPKRHDARCSAWRAGADPGGCICAKKSY